jgi:integrase
MNAATTHRLLKLAIQRAELISPDGKLLSYTPHDFRKIFTSEAVSNDLPVHIAAKLLGHNDLGTTQTYVAVYNDDTLRHHRSFIARRRAPRSFDRSADHHRQPQRPAARSDRTRLAR